MIEVPKDVSSSPEIGLVNEQTAADLGRFAVITETPFSLAPVDESKELAGDIIVGFGPDDLVMGPADANANVPAPSSQAGLQAVLTRFDGPRK